jgi:uncharacterized protein YkwD
MSLSVSGDPLQRRRDAAEDQKVTPWRALTVTATAGLCLLGAAAPAQAGVGPWKSPALSPRTAAAGSTAPPPAAVATVVDPSVTFAARIAALVNVERAAAGLAPLAVSGCAGTFAVTWSRHMASTGDFSHQSLSPIMTGCGARGAGENIAYGATSPEQFMSLWMNSSGHRANILRASFTHVGVGVARSADGRWYATQDFLTA